MGAKPIAPAPTVAPSSSGAPASPAGTISYEQLQAMGAKPISSTAAPTVPAAPRVGSAGQALDPGKGDVLDQLGDVASKVFPGAALGRALTNSGAAIVDASHGDFAGAEAEGDKNANDYGKIVGDAAQAVTLPASLAIGGPTGTGARAVASRVAVNAGLGGAFTGANAAARGASPTETAVDTGIGAVGGGALSGAAEALSPILNPTKEALQSSAIVGSSRVDLQACKLEYSIVSPK